MDRKNRNENSIAKKTSGETSESEIFRDNFNGLHKVVNSNNAPSSHRLLSFTMAEAAATAVEATMEKKCESAAHSDK